MANQRMRLQLLGTGSPIPLPERLGPAVALSINDDRLLFDAGRGVTTQLVRAGIALDTLTAIFLTHHHYDHIGNLGDLLLTAWHAGIGTLPVIGPPGTEAIVQALFEQVYQREIMFSLALASAAQKPERHIREVVNVTPISAGQSYHRRAWRVTAAAVEHGHQLGLSHEAWPCLAYSVEAAGKSVVISGDTIACANLIRLARHADVLVHCCFFADAALTTPYQRLLADQVIASSGQTGKVAAQAGVKTVVLTHFGAMPPDMLTAIIADVQRDFAGQIYLGEDLMALEI